MLAAFASSRLSAGQARALRAPVAHPIARVLIGKSKGDTVEVAAPRRRKVVRNCKGRIPL